MNQRPSLAERLASGAALFPLAMAAAIWLPPPEAGGRRGPLSA